MPVRSARAVWEPNEAGGGGEIVPESGDFRTSYSRRSRFEQGTGSNPEELLGAAHAACFSMALSLALSADGHQPERVETEAKVHIDRAEAGFRITLIELSTVGRVPGITSQTFSEFADRAKRTCPVSMALAGAEITLEARLEE
ncbi:MAG: OsmC family peroxiredoxin [Candidatus Dormiibacterota bacterium]